MLLMAWRMDTSRLCMLQLARVVQPGQTGREKRVRGLQVLRDEVQRAMGWIELDMLLRFICHKSRGERRRPRVIVWGMTGLVGVFLAGLLLPQSVVTAVGLF